MRRALALGALVGMLGCDVAAAPLPDASVPMLAPRAEAPARDDGPRTAAPAIAAPRIEVPSGTVLAGSRPGTPFRRPSREADELPIELPAFAIDRLPFPNEPLAPPTLVASRAEASTLCEARGARLCTELEWERACEGDAHHTFAGGASFDADRCSREATACASDLGVLRLGELAPEWTASDVPPESIRGGRTVVQRGARADAPADLHRCDARTFELPEGAAPAAFRCCTGPSAPSYPPVRMSRDFRDLASSTAELRAALRSIPELAAYADGFEPYGEADGDRALACAGADRRALAGWELAPGPIAWSPSAGEEAWVLAGRSGGAALIAVLYPLGGGRFGHASSFVLEGEELPIAIARTPPSRAELQWSACWGTPAEGGVIRWGDDSVIRIVQR